MEAFNKCDVSPIYWSFAIYITHNNINFLSYSIEEKIKIYNHWFKKNYDIYFVKLKYTTINIESINTQLDIFKNTFYLNVNTRKKTIPSSTKQIWCVTNSSHYSGFHKLCKLISKNNKIESIYFGHNGLGCNADDYYTKTHLDNENNLELPQLFTETNRMFMQANFEKLLEFCPRLIKIHICGYHFQCSTDTDFFKRNKHIIVYLIYNNSYETAGVYEPTNESDLDSDD
jgi:hypothetical protein